MTELLLHANRLTGTHFFAQIDRLVYEFTTTFKRPPCCVGTIPTELGRCTAMKELYLYNNQLTGEHFFAQIDRSVYEYTSVLYGEYALASTRTACMCVQCELTMRHASRPRSRCTGGDAFETFMMQTVPAYVGL